MKIKAIVKRPDERYGHMTHVSNTLENLQRIVGGYIEVLPIGGDLLIICNEEGKLENLEDNMEYGDDMLVGTIIVVGENGEEFGDIPISFEEWKSLVDADGRCAV